MSQRRKRIGRAVTLCLLVAAAVVGLSTLALRLGKGSLPLGVMLPLLAALFAIAMLASIPWWRTQDHMERDAHLTSLYWGGLSGAGLMFMGLIAGMGADSELVSGAAYLLIAQMVGYFLFWLGWWFTHRAGGS